MSRSDYSVADLCLIGLLAAVLALGAAPDARAQDVQAGLDAVARKGGGVYRLPNAHAVVRNGVVVPEYVTFDLDGGELVAVLTDANAAGVRLRSNSAIRNGSVTVISKGFPGTQAGAHASILVGALHGENPAPDRLSPFEAPHDWAVSDLILQSDKQVAIGDGNTVGAAAIQVVGGAHNGKIERITVPDSAILYGGVLFEWGTVGAIFSNDVVASAAVFRKGAGYTTHPSDILVRDITIGRLTLPARNEMGSFGIRLSGVRDVRVEGVDIGETTEAAFLHTAGDLGFEFARDPDRIRAMQGIVIDGITVAKAGNYLVRSDSYADNVGRAAASGYRPAQPPIGMTDIVVRNVWGSAARQGTGYGLRIDHQRGGQFADMTARGFNTGFFVDEQAYDLFLVRPVASESGSAGISIGHPLRPPARISISDPRAEGQNRAARDLIIGRSDDVSVSGTTSAQVRVVDGARRARVPASLDVSSN